MVVALAALVGLTLAGCAKTGSGGPGPGPSTTTTTTSAPADLNPGDVAVLVVDDFKLDTPAPPVPGMTGNCGVGANVVGSSGAGDDLVLDNISHGELVYRTLRDSLAALVTAASGAQTGNTTAPATPLASGAPRVVEMTTDWTYPGGSGPHRIRLAAVNATGYTSQNIINGIQAAITQQTRAGFHRFVLNLSFVIVPCDPMSLLTGSSPQDVLNDYLRLVGTDAVLRQGLADALGIQSDQVNLATLQGNSSKLETAVLNDNRLGPLRGCLVGAVYKEIGKAQVFSESKIAQQLMNDPAWQALQSSVGQGHGYLTAVGAAGNGVQCGKNRTSFPFPFAPALWDGVVSVSSENPAGGIMAYSNSGEVKLDGTGPNDLMAGSRGTSFAAPRLSAEEAIYLLLTGKVQCGTERPPLAYVDQAARNGAPTSGVLPWKDEGRPAWPGYCPDFRTVTGV
jgi:hypothetical protein